MANDATDEQGQIQFDLRALFTTIGLMGVAFALLRGAAGARGGAIHAFLAGTAMIAAIVFRLLAPLAGIKLAERKTAFTVACLVPTVLCLSSIAIAMEWSNDHPWPNSDVTYVITAVVRFTLLGLLIGYGVAAVLGAAFGRSVATEPSRAARPPKRPRFFSITAGVLSIALLLLLWWPVRPWYQKKLAAEGLLAAIEAADCEAIASRVPSVRSFGAEADAASCAFFQALHAPDKRVRVAAIEALRLLDNEIRAMPVLRPALVQMLNDPDNDVRAAAREYLSLVNSTP